MEYLERLASATAPFPHRSDRSSTGLPFPTERITVRNLIEFNSTCIRLFTPYVTKLTAETNRAVVRIP
jgi:hypothetical protein